MFPAAAMAAAVTPTVVPDPPPDEFCVSGLPDCGFQPANGTSVGALNFEISFGLVSLPAAADQRGAGQPGSDVVSGRGIKIQSEASGDVRFLPGEPAFLQAALNRIG